MPPLAARAKAIAYRDTVTLRSVRLDVDEHAIGEHVPVHLAMAGVVEAHDLSLHVGGRLRASIHGVDAFLRTFERCADADLPPDGPLRQARRIPLLEVHLNDARLGREENAFRLAVRRQIDPFDATFERLRFRHASMAEQASCHPVALRHRLRTDGGDRHEQ